MYIRLWACLALYTYISASTRHNPLQWRIQRGALTYFWHNSFRKLHENEKKYCERDSRPLDPSLPRRDYLSKNTILAGAAFNYRSLQHPEESPGDCNETGDTMFI